MRIPFVLAVLLSSPVFLQPEPEPEPLSVSQLDSFPLASDWLRIPAREPEGWNLEQLLDEYGRLTDQHFMIRDSARSHLQQTPVPLGDALEVKPENIHSVVESIMSSCHFALAILRDECPRLISVDSLQNAARSNLRQRAIYVPVEELGAWRDHPAYLINTLLTLDASDVRTMTNSMRAMLTDANTQGILPVGNSNSMIITGFAPQVADLATMLSKVNEDAKRLAKARKPSKVQSGKQSTEKSR